MFPIESIDLIRRLTYLIRGTVPHPPKSDLEEVRNSLTLQFNGAPTGIVIAHIFNDGTIKTSTQMHKEINERSARDKRLTAEENKFPQLRQTTRRIEAKDRMMARIQAARSSISWSIIQKQIEKQNATEEYNLVLQMQAEERGASNNGSG